METSWVPGVNNLDSNGHWTFAEFTSVFAMESDFKTKVETAVTMMIEDANKNQRKMEQV